MNNDEARHGRYLYKNGIIRDIYFRQDRPGVVIIVEAYSVELAKMALDAFPLAKASVIGWEIIPFGLFVNWEELLPLRTPDICFGFLFAVCSLLQHDQLI